jgi:hypothetical protein
VARIEGHLPEVIRHAFHRADHFFDGKGLIRRHDYTAAVSGDAKVAHYLYDHQIFDGIVFPTRRRVYLRGPDLKPQKDLVIISADLSDFKLSRAGP